jgi:hypothetical protein
MVNSQASSVLSPEVMLKEHFVKHGYCVAPGLFDPTAAKDLLDTVRAHHRFDEKLFFTEDEWERSPKTHRHTNPGPGYNVLEKFPDKLDFVEQSPEFQKVAEALLGCGYRIFHKKLICRIPRTMIPGWLQRKIEGRPTNTFNTFMHPEFRTISFFFENDLHQDVQDWSRVNAAQREHRIITMYVYLDMVTSKDAPVVLLPDTHIFGATPFQHNIERVGQSDHWRYTDVQGRSMERPLVRVMGDAGDAAMWHGCLLHGSHPIQDGRLRISLRYILARSADPAPCGIDEINDQIMGPAYLEEDYSAGSRATPEGTWTMEHNDFTRMGLLNLAD